MPHRGEQAATALEVNLSNLESTLDALLARFDSVEKAPASKESRKDDEPQGGDKAANAKPTAPAE